jgi:amino acid adenylation domain-containing protein/thioester reductase-like protein
MTTDQRPDVRPASGSERFPASPAQAGLWFATTYGDDPTAYNQPLVLRLPVMLDHDHLLAALHAVQQAHTALRTTFEMDPSGDVQQVVHNRLNPIVDVRDHPSDEPEEWVKTQVAEVAAAVVDLRQGPLARVRHLRLAADGTSRLVFNVHHSVFDGMSWKPYLGQLEAAYTVVARGGRPERAPRRQAVESYARWTERCRSASGSEALRFWRDKLANAPATTKIGLPGQGPPSNTERRLVLDEQATRKVREFCAAEGVTTSMFFTALFFVLVHRQTRQDDVLLGMPVTVREGADAEVVGHLTNTVVLRHRLTGDATTRGVLRAVKREVLDALRHRHAPLEAVVQEIRKAGDYQGATADLFNAMITVMPASARNLDLRAWGVKTWEYTSGGAKYDLVLVVDEALDHYTLIVEHTSTSDDGADFAAYLGQRVKRLLQSMIAHPDAAVHDLDWIGEDEERAVTALCSRQVDAPELGTELTADLFTRAVESARSEPAVVTADSVLSYAELDDRVDAVATTLVARGVRDGRPVAVLMRPGADLVATVLGILRAGGSYVALDPEHPAERLSFAIADCGASILVRDPGLDVPEMALPADLEIVTGATRAPTVGPPARPDPTAPPRKTPSDTAYIVYTSGSTGRPKGVVIAETTLANLVHSQAELSSGRRLRTLQYMSPAFDVFAEELVGTLCTGGTLVIPSADLRTDFEGLAALLAEQRVARAFFPYVALRELAAVLQSSALALPDLREVYVTGERLVVTDDLRAMFRRHPDARLINLYGPSEAHLCTANPMPADPDTWPTLPPIGRVVRGVDVRVLLDGDRLAPFGVEGELCITGPVVSPGYVDLPEQTRQAMVPDPFAGTGQRMYRTGDVVILAPDGRLHFRGRSDDQIKIRGYRVEPGDVESALERVPGVNAAAVIASSAGSDRELHAFVQTGAQPPADWRARLGAVLPGYMIPRTVTRIDRIPLTPTGKTDRRALESRHLAQGGPTEAAADETRPAPGDLAGDRPAESERLRTLAELWTEVLGHGPATPDDDFFLLGGHSLLAARLHRLVKQRFDTEVGLSRLLSTPTLRGMADSLAEGGEACDATSSLGLREEARLHDLVVAERREPCDDTVLLTGATGFLGCHLLHELQAAGRRVCCLVRADTEADARDRVRRAFEKFSLDTTRVDDIEICLGDLSRPELGLGAADRSRSRSVSEVYHAAAHINFVVPYHTVKRTNVDGLRNLLDFCAINRTPLRLISTMGVFPPDDTSGTVSEDAVPGDPRSLGIGYSQSKWVAEHLALQARHAGLPVTLHRIGRIGGHSRTGACRHDDFFWLQMKGFAVLGRYPEDLVDAPPIDLLPVDYVAQAVVGLSSDKPDDETWHLFHSEGLGWPTIVETIRSAGYALEPTARSAWMAALERQAETENQGEGLGSLVPFMREGVMRLGDQRFENEKTRLALADVGCPQPAGDTGWICRMFEYFRAVGAVPPPNAGGRNA